MPETNMTPGFAATTVLGRDPASARCESCDRLRSEVARLCERAEQDRQTIHALRNRCNELTVQTTRDRIIARSQPEGPEGGRR